MDRESVQPRRRDGFSRGVGGGEEWNDSLMTLKRIATFGVVSVLAAVCLNLFGQPSATNATRTNAAPRAARVNLESLPIRTIADVTRDWNRKHPTGSNDFVHLRGTVLDQRVGEYIAIRDETGALYARSTNTIRVELQAEVDVWGIPDGNADHLTLLQATFHLVNSAGIQRTNGAAAEKPAVLQVLTKASQVRELTATEAGWEFPVKIHGVVTLSIHRMRTYVEDDSGTGVFVRVRGVNTSVKPGDLVEIEGRSNPGMFVSMVVARKITVLGTAPMPEPTPVTLFQMADGQYDGKWVEAHAVVRETHYADGVLQLKLSDRDGTFMANIPADTARSNLVDSVVRVRGVCTSTFNTKRQITGVEMWSPSTDFIQVTEPAAADPFTMPTQPIIALSQSQMRTTLQRRIKVAGIITAYDVGKSFYIQDADDGIQIFPSEKTNVRPGDKVEVVGYPTPGDYGNVIRDAVFRVTGNGPLPAPKHLVEESPLDPQLNDLWVEADAQVANEPETDPDPVLPLQIGSTIFKAHILSPVVGKHLPTRGCTVHIAGVYQILADDMRAPRAFRLVVPSDSNVQITTRPSVWTFQHAMLAVGSMVIVACVALLWVLLLRQKVTEQTAILQQSEVKFRSLVEQSLVGVYVIQDGRFAYVNPRLAEIYGYSVEELTAPSFNLQDTILEEDRPMVAEQMQRRISGESPKAHYAFRARRKDGQTVHMEVMGCRADYNGKPAIMGTAMDITERTVAETRLAEASNLLDTLLDNIPDFIYFKDRLSRFVRASRAFEKLFQLSDVKSLKGKTDFDFFVGDHARQAYEDEQEIMRTGKPIIGKLESEMHSDGRMTHALTTKMPWRDTAGNIIGTFGISKDVTALKETEAKLALERDLLHTLMENFPDVIYFKDLKSQFVRVSQSKMASSMKIVLGRHRATHPNEAPEQLPEHLKSMEKFGAWLMGKSDFDTFAKERAQSAYDDEQKIIQTGEPIVAKIEKTPQTDGRTTWCISTKMPWRDKEGKMIGTFGVSKDITPLKEAEQELEAAHQRLIETSRLAGMAEVATDVLHNVGNVLNSVNVSCSLTIDRVRNSKVAGLAKTAALLEENRSRLAEFFKSDPRAQQVPGYLTALSEHFGHEQTALLQELEQLLKHIEHIKQIVAMQQSYAKVAGVIETVNPTQLVDDAIHINGAALTRHEVQVHCDFQPVPMIHTEKHRVLQILVNLIRNAKYALDESKRTDKLLTIRMRKNGGGHVKIEVIDNGVGIPEENLTRIFGHGFTTRRNGHGFGLHSSALAIKELGGSLTAHSDGVGKGAIFTLVLPENPPPTTEEAK